jgi:AcrR family transcriptional regulator
MERAQRVGGDRMAGAVRPQRRLAADVRSRRRLAAAPRSRRRLAADVRREELIAAAVAVLRAGSEQRNWVAAVAREAGVAKGTFYVHFRSWEEMLATVRARLIALGSAPLREALEAPGAVAWWAVFERQAGAFIDMALEFREQHGLIFHSPLPASLEGADASHAGTALLGAAIERGIADGCFASVDVEAAAVLLLAAVHAAADAVLAGDERSRWIAACMELARGYLTPPVDPAVAVQPPAGAMGRA